MMDKGNEPARMDLDQSCNGCADCRIIVDANLNVFIEAKSTDHLKEHIFGLESISFIERERHHINPKPLMRLKKKDAVGLIYNLLDLGILPNDGDVEKKEVDQGTDINQMKNDIQIIKLLLSKYDTEGGKP